MEHDFWSTRWRAGQTGFHLDRVNPSLRQFWSEIIAARESGTGAELGSVLVPLCGKSLDLVWLAEQGHRVRGVEFVEEAVQAFFVELGQSPRREELGAATRYVAGDVELLQGDFFKLTPEHLEPVAIVYDRAALVAISPERRVDYFAQLRRLSRPGARLFLINFVHDMGSGPPFSIPEADLLAAAAGSFALVKRSERDVLEHEPRFRERGATRLEEQVWFGTRID